MVNRDCIKYIKFGKEIYLCELAKYDILSWKVKQSSCLVFTEMIMMMMKAMMTLMMLLIVFGDVDQHIGALAWPSMLGAFPWWNHHDQYQYQPSSSSSSNKSNHHETCKINYPFCDNHGGGVNILMIRSWSLLLSFYESDFRESRPHR